MKCLEPTFRQMAKWRFQPKAQRTYGGQRKQIVSLPACHHGPLPGGHHSGHPNVTYCLEIQVTLTEELGAIPPPSHLWMAPLMEDMLQEARTGLTKAVVIGPGRLVLFYWRHSMGEGLKVDEARDAGFLPHRSRHLGRKGNDNPMTIQEGKRAIAQAISDNRVKARGPGHLMLI